MVESIISHSNIPVLPSQRHLNFLELAIDCSEKLQTIRMLKIEDIADNKTHIKQQKSLITDFLHVLDNALNEAMQELE